MGSRIERLDRLDPEQVRAVTRLVDAVTDADGVRPLSEHVMLHLRHGGDDPTRNFLQYDGDELVGYAHLDVSDPVEGPSAELTVAPHARRRGHGRALVDALLDESGGNLRLWAHGEGDAARALAGKLGFRQDRVLWQMRRSLYAPLPEPRLPAGITIRTFVVGRDEEGWVAVNARAFAEHPEQGTWTIEDLRLREREPWFDASGFFLAEHGDDLVGFHWTKVHGADGSHHHEPIGEVYVVGVDPSMQGKRLGPALTLVGLRHLRARGLSQVMLYVDETNTPAIGIYEELGFARWDTDLCYRKTAG
ncbi:MAG TPA: mycothiol synthase [Mycobacteriales bacterium]|jgi:mycothiol synthase|nr:mycothiol synthase [Mycobacteriales bacterium]